MKKRIAALLTFAMSVTLLAGCGSSSDSSTTTSSTSKKSDTLSECFSKEKVIAYEVSEIDKASTPKKVYFFEDGKVSIIPGSEFDMKMGDFAKMTDKEIWKKYEKVRKAYKEDYAKTEEKEADKGRYVLQQFGEQEGKEFCNLQYPDIQVAVKILEAAKGKTVAELEGIELSDIIDNADETRWFRGTDTVSAVEVCLADYFKVSGTKENYTKEELSYGYSSTADNPTFSERLVNDAIEFYNYAVKELKKIYDEVSYKGPFFDLPFEFVIVTDSSGNNVAKEKLVYPTLQDTIGKVPETYYATLDFANVEGADREIYDTTYNCLGIGTGGSTFCTRASVSLDTVDSKKVLIDLDSDEMNELFEKEVKARYK